MPNRSAVNGSQINAVEAPPAPPPLPSLGTDDVTFRVKRHRMDPPGGKS